MHVVDAFEALARIPPERRSSMPSFIGSPGGPVADIWPTAMAALGSLSGKLANVTTAEQLGQAVVEGLTMMLDGRISTTAWGDESRRIARMAVHRAKMQKMVASSMN